MRVLLVDNEVNIRSRLRAQMQDHGIHVTVASTVADATAALALHSVDVVIVELTLPDGSGLDVLEHLHASGSTAHVIVASGSTIEVDRVRALDRGADDFVVKPFYLRELTARVLAMGRRRDPIADSIVQVGRFEIDLRARQVSAAGERVELTTKEFDLLAYLAVRPGHVFDREQLLNAVWRSASEWQQDATVTEHIRRLRKHLETDPAHPEILVTVRGAGYRLDLPAVEAEAPTHIDPVIDEGTRLRRLLTGVLADLTDAIIITDLHFHIRSWNVAAERLYGWTESEVRGRHVFDVLHGISDTEQIPEMWERLEHTGRWHGENTQVARDGSSVQILSSTTLIRDETGDPLGIVSVNRSAADARFARSLEQDADLAARLRHGLADGEFVVHYQPVVDLADGRLIALEALVRWEHPERGMLLPEAFLGVAERSGSIVELGELVLDTACRQAAAWRRSGADIGLAVNLSTRQLADPGMAERFTRIVRDAGFDPAFLWLEVTETAVVEEPEKVRDVLRRLVDLGVRVSIDDFGTGWASLTYLRSFPVHALKIDRSFVARADHTANDGAIIRSILSLGAELDLFVVAEGIETQTQLDELQQLGCSFGQGYLFGRPSAAGDVSLEGARRISTEPSSPEDVVDLAVSGTATAATSHTDERGSRRHNVAVLDHAPSPLRRLQPASRASTPALVATNSADVESDVVANLLRGLLRIRSAPAAADLLHATIRSMGGVPVPAAEATADALPIDVSLGEGPPVLVEVEQLTVARMQLERLLPRLVEDARQAVDLLRQTERLVEETARDGLTGLANRRVLDRVLPRATSGSVAMIDLDHFKEVNDRHGHAAGDDVLVAFGKVLTEHVRARDTSCRIGGEEFALVLGDADTSGAVELISRIRRAWSAIAPLGVTFSAGVAAVESDGGMAALLAADRALYQAKHLGRDRTELASSLSDRVEP